MNGSNMIFNKIYCYLFKLSVYRLNYSPIISYTVYFLLTLVFLGLNNKIILLLFFCYLAFLLLVKNYSIIESLLYTYLIASFIPNGKMYLLELIPSGSLDSNGDYPNGYYIFFRFGSFYIIGIILFISVLFILFKKLILRKVNFNNSEISLVLFSTSLVIRNIFTPFSHITFLCSTQIFMSCLFYLSYKFIDKENLYKVINNIFSIYLVIVCFEFLLSISQVLNQGLLGLGIERIYDIHYFSGQENLSIYRPIGTMGHTNELAYFCATIFLYSIGKFILKYKYEKLNIWLYISVLSFITLLLTSSRSAWVSLSIVLLLIFYIDTEVRIKLLDFIKTLISYKYIYVIVFVACFTLFPRLILSINTFDSGGSMTSRIDLLSEGISIVPENMFFGTGIDLSPYYMFLSNPNGIMKYFTYPVHMAIVTMILENGLIISSFFIYFCIYSLSKIWMKYLHNKKNYEALFLFFSVIFIFINSFFQPSFDYLLIFVLLLKGNYGIKY